MASIDAAPSFKQHIAPLFRDKDKAEMTFAFDLSEYEDVRDSAPGILSRLERGDMPCDAPWPEDRINLFRIWIETGMQE
jgi:hypothetical protein